ncbi:MAG: SDR family NAD(P)-dependent oxidoreductase [Pseudomonadota bacterium]
MESLLNDKIAIVTGATRGIGLAIAEALCAQGAHVFVNGRDLGATQRVVDELTTKGFKATELAFDVANSDSVAEGFKRFRKHSKVLDILVNNAGVLDDALIGMVSDEQIEQTFATNTFSVLYTCRYAARFMMRRKSGSIINLASIIGLTGNAGQTVYGGSKAAVIGITESLAKELGQEGIRVNAIAPGFIDTDMARSLPEEIFEQRIASVNMGRIGAAEEVASAVTFLASDMSSYITGQTLGVDGGMLI